MTFFICFQLQQYRQKKDNKGGKSSGKPGKSGSDASTNPANVPAASPATQHVPDAERLHSSNDAVSLSEPHTVKESVDSNTNVPVTVDPEEKPTNSTKHEPVDLLYPNSGNTVEALAPRVDEERLHSIEQVTDVDCALSLGIILLSMSSI